MYSSTGTQWDLETSGYYYRHRIYHALLGRFGSRDPIGYGDGESLYRAFFVPNSQDPSGLVPISCGCYSNWYNWDVHWVTVDCTGLASTCCESACQGFHGFSGQWGIVGAAAEVDCAQELRDCNIAVRKRMEQCEGRGWGACLVACGYRFRKDVIGKGCIKGSICLFLCTNIYWDMCQRDESAGFDCCELAFDTCQRTGEWPGLWWRLRHNCPIGF